MREIKSKFLFSAASAVFILIPSIAFGAMIPNIGVRETSNDPEIVRTEPIKWSGYTSSATSPTKPQAQTATMSPAATANTSSTLGPNLVQNPSLETAGSSGLPANWKKGGYGSNTRVLTYPASGSGGSSTKAISVSVSNYSSGDAKWYPDEISVMPGRTYQFSDSYKSTASSIVELRFTLSDGSFSYKDIATPGASANFATVSGQAVAPANATSVTIFHLLNKNGTLTTDDYSLQEVIPQQSGNLLPNGDFEQAGSNSLPLDWTRGGYGNSTRTFTYPVPGQSGNGAKVTVSNYVSGDAKWASNPVDVSPGVYTYADSYTATVPSTLTAEFTLSNGSLSYSDLKALPAASSWASASASFTVPSGAVSVRVFHLIQANGSLTIDNASIVQSSSSQSGIFSTGAVTFRFDDGLLDQYQNAAPVLQAEGLTATFYIITHEIYDDGYTGYMSIAQVKNLYSEGFEIGAHTQTHPHLTTLSASQQQTEIAGSRQDLLGWDVGPVLSFAYPFGEYDSTTLSIVKNAGFTSAISTMSGYVTPASDHYQLEYQEAHNDTTLAQVESWVNTAAQNHTWLILTFHDISSNTSDEYNVTPAMFKSIADYVKQKGIPVVSATQGMSSM